MARKAAWPPRVYSRGGIEYCRPQLDGRRQWITLGPAGSDQARAEYRRLLAEMESGGRLPSASGLTVAELVAAYDRHAEGYHCERQLDRIRRALVPVASLYGHLPAVDFGPVALRACRQTWIAEGLARTYVESLRWCVYGAWRWAASRELVPSAVAAALLDLEPLRKGHCDAPEPPPVRPADPEAVRAALPHLNAVVGAMVRFQRHTGCRPGEAVRLRPCDLDREYLTVGLDQVWLYRLDGHKNDWRGMLRWIPVGPQAQAVLTPLLDRDPDHYVFCPAEAGRSNRFKRRPRERYDSQTYARAVLRGCRRAGVEPWAPNQLRHLRATEIETALGREDARCVLGHSNPSMTARYAESVERAARVLARLG